MSKKEEANSTRHSRLPVISAQTTTAAKTDCDLNQSSSLNQCYVPGALFRSPVVVPVTPPSSSSPKRLGYKRRKRRRNNNCESTALHYIGLNAFCAQRSSSSLLLLSTATNRLTSAFRLASKRRIISNHCCSLYLILLCSVLLLDVVDLFVVNSETVNRGDGTTVSGSRWTLSSTFAEHNLRPNRIPDNLRVNDKNNDVSIQTKHGLFKGVLLSSDRWHDEFKTTTRSRHKTDDINDASVVGFLGIRYASAPIKRLRFMPPTAYHYAPNQVHNMQHFGPICRQRWPIDLANHFSGGNGQAYELATARMRASSGKLRAHSTATNSRELDTSSSNSSDWDIQMRLMRRMMPKESYAHLRPLFKRLIALEQSEDCLNLNIYTPIEAITNVIGSSGEKHRNSTSLLPVLVIIHGESFDYGAGSTINGFKFVQQNRLLAITFNYRLNILGFPPKLAGASRGNLGLMDQVAALHWIKDNIGSFGGSANNITLMGTKRGAIFVNLLMLSPLAKGLFQRAIMEDGSALTPLVANHIISPPMGFHSPPSSQSLISSPAIQHVRFLAKLCDCPVYQRPSSAVQVNVSSSASSSASSLSSSSGSISSATTSSLSGQQLLGFADETKTNALTFECLRHKPIEQIMQRVPLDLLHFNQANGDILIAARWLNTLHLGQQLDPDSTLELHRTTTTSTNIPTGAANEMVPVDGQQLNKLVFQITRDQLDRERMGSIGGSGSGIPSSPSAEDLSGGELAKMRNELFGAIYTPPRASIRPLFGPVIDGTIVPDEDIAVGMLKQGSTFAQRDLLIGLSHPAISAAPNLNDKPAGDHQLVDVSEQGSGQVFELRPDHMMVDRITAQMERVGLTNEQAVDMVNVFVRSFYRYHNQEITNSIINHYLSGTNRGAQVLKRLGSHKLSSLKTATTLSANVQGGHDGGDKDDHDVQMAKMNQQQLLVRDLLLEAFQDALTNVPLLKTALIHATKQLDSLVDVFVGQQFEKWDQHRLLDVNHSSSASSHFTIPADAASSPPNPLDQRLLMESFVSFAQTLFNDSGWPLELHSPSNMSIQQPKATYLFQFDSSFLVKKVQRSINSLELIGGSIRGGSRGGDYSMRSIKEMLNGLLLKLNSAEFRNKLGFGCTMDFIETLNNDDNDNDYNTTEDDLSVRFKNWLCSRLSSILGNFVAIGNVNTDHQLEGVNIEPLVVDQTPIPERVAQFEAKCLLQRTISPHSSTADHHSVQPAGSVDDSSTHEFGLSDECRRDLNSMAFDYLIRSDQFDQQQQGSPQNPSSRWTVFNLFTQQVATLPVSSKSLWQMNQISDGAAQYDQKSTFSARSSFWSNFIPALNCTKTQPIIPTYLLSSSSPLASASNSSLLNLNLLFSCQQGAKTSYDAIDSLITSIRHHLQAKIVQWKETRSSSIAAQNHHSLRMANMSQSGSSDDNLDQQELPIMEEQSKGIATINGSSMTSDLVVSTASVDSRPGGNQQQRVPGDRQGAIDLRTKYGTGIVLIFCGLLISFTLISGACAVLRKRNQSKSQRRKLPPICLDDRQFTSHQMSSGSNSMMTEQPQQLQPKPQMSSQIVVNNNNVNEEEDDDDDDFVRPPSHHHHQTNEQSALSIDAAVAMNHLLNDCEHQSVSANYTTSSNSIQPSMVGQQATSANHVLTVGDQEGFVYWDTTNGGQLLNGTITLCRSHSSLNGTNNGSTIAETVAQSPMEQLTTCSEHEPIMMPILTTQFGGGSSSIRPGCLTSNGHYGGSSSETQGGHSSVSSTQKKRVKISDPYGTAKRSSNLKPALSGGGDSNFYGQHLHNTLGSHLRINDSVYCPVHRNQSNHSLTAEHTAANYFVDDSSFLTANNIDLTWNGGGASLIDQQRLASVSSNCDYFSSNTNTTTTNTANNSQQGSYVGGQHCHYANTDLDLANTNVVEQLTVPGDSYANATNANVTNYHRSR